MKELYFFPKKKILSKQVEFGSAYIFYLLGDFERSIKLLEEIKIEDNSTKRISYLIYYLLGNIYYEQSRLADSLNCFDEALTINPKFAKGYFLRAKIHKLFGNTRLAINDFNKSFQIMIENINDTLNYKYNYYKLIKSKVQHFNAYLWCKYPDNIINRMIDLINHDYNKPEILSVCMLLTDNQIDFLKFSRLGYKTVEEFDKEINNIFIVSITMPLIN